MAMTPQCIQAVNAAAGKALTPAQIANIDSRINAAMRHLAFADTTRWRGLSADQRIMEGAQQAMQDIADEAARKVQNAQLQALATASTEDRIHAVAAAMGKLDRTRALVEDMNNTALYADGIKRSQVGQLMDLMDAVRSGQGASGGRRVMMKLLDAENPVMTRDLAAEIFDNASGVTGNKLAKEGAKAWLEVIEGMRTRFNAAGGDVGKLAYGYLPQPHDSARIRNASPDAWAAKVLPLLDRARYLLEDGSRMSDAQVMDMLRGVHETLATDGMNKQVPGQFKGSGARANRGSDGRQIHFKDGAAYQAYLSAWGRGSMYDAMVGHIGGLSKDIALVERYGPNPSAQMQLQFDLAARDAGTSVAELPRDMLGNRPQAYWDIISGTTGAPVSARLAQVGQDARNIQVFGKLGSAVISSVTDLGTIAISTGYNKLSYWDLFKNIGGQAKKANRDFLTQHGIIAETMIGDINRWAGENIRNNWSGRLANSTMKLSLMNAWTDSLRRGFSMTMMQGLAKLKDTPWDKLTEWDRTHLARKGIDEADWGVINQAQLTQHNGRDFLTPEAIAASGDPRAEQVISKVLGFITDESEYAVVNPDLTTRAASTWGGQQAGTGTGELARLTMQFKSFPIAMLTRHWRRMLEGTKGLEGAPLMANPAAYGFALAVTSLGLGAMAFQAKQMINGKDPVDMGTAKFWSRAFAQGGGAGFIGDILLSDTTSDRSSLDTLSRMAMGPTYGAVADVFDLTKGNVDEYIAGKDTHAGAEAARFVKSNLPYVNLWYAKAAIDHSFTHALQENLSPGYLSRMQQRARKEYGQNYWWRPGASFDEMRAPDMGAAIGQ